MNEALTLRPHQDVATQAAMSLPAIMERVMTGELTAEKVSLLERLVKMSAEQQFNQKFVELQGDLPTIVASSVIPNRGKYERFEDIMRVVGPLLTKHGFTVSFSQDFKENRILETCTLSHAAGHSRSNSFAVRSGGRADSDAQADCKASTTAKRNALCNALNVVIRQDCLNYEEDASIEGDPKAFITPEQADEFERRAQLLDCVKSFLAFAKAPKFAEIPASRHEELELLLSRKERTAK